MNMDDVKAFIMDHPKELGIAGGGLVIGYLVFGRSKAADTGDDIGGEDAMDISESAIPANGYSTPVAPISYQPPGITHWDYSSRGKVPEEIARNFRCQDAGTHKRVWGRDEDANTIVCRDKVTGKDSKAIILGKDGKPKLTTQPVKPHPLAPKPKVAA